MSAPTKLSFFALALALALPTLAAPVPVGDVKIQRSGFLYNRSTNTFDTQVTLLNAGTVPLAAPLRLVVDQVRPRSVSLYNIYGKTAQGKPYVEVPLREFVLAPGASASVPVRFVNLGKTITAASFSVEAEQLKPDNTATLDITATFNAENGGTPAGPQFAVKVDGVTRALTDAEGRATLQTPLDASEVTVQEPPNFFGAATLPPLVAGEDLPVAVELGDSGEFGVDSKLRIDRLQHLMLPQNVPAVTLRFFHDEKPVAGDLIELVELRDPAGSAPQDITSLFVIRPDGSLNAETADFFDAVGNLAGKKLLFAQVLDEQGLPHLQEVPFYVSRYTAQARLIAPPSQPDLPVGGIPIEVAVLNTDIAFQTESAANGTFPLPLVPAGSLTIRATTSRGGISYLGMGTAVITSNVRIELRMRGPVDVDNNVAPIATSPL